MAKMLLTRRKMEFNSKTDLALFFSQLEKDGWIETEWTVKPITMMKDGKEIEGTRATRVFKINFNNVKKGEGT
jgi:hypothetical protein